MRIAGTAWVYGDNVNTDVIFPGKYTYTLKTPEEIAAHALEDLDASFAGQVRKGDIVFGGRNWGCGSSREQAVTTLVYAGVGAVVAASFARIYYRNAINNGLPVIICPEALAAVSKGDRVELLLEEGCLRIAEREFSFPAYPDSIQRIVQAGGLLPFIRQKR
jgi:3-isopropylmalate/(R)-2-methylmalate dehydratase small subunit